MDLLSVIVPVYKVEPYLRRCLDSIINQTYKNLEIILIDDGSPDNCGEICDEYALIDNRIKVIHKENGGVSSARNVGLESARGSFIAFVDSDDYLDYEMYETLIKIAKEEQSDIVECGYRWIKPEGIRDIDNTRNIDIYTNLEALETLYFGDQISGGLSIVVWNKIYNSRLLQDIRFENGLSEDVLFTPQAYHMANKVVKYNFNLYNFFFSPNSLSRSSYNIRNTTAASIRRRVVDYFDSLGLKKYKEFAFMQYISCLYNDYYECYTRRNDNIIFMECYINSRNLILKAYFKIMNNPYFSSKWKHKLFHFSPFLWYLLAKIYKKIKVTR